MSLANPVAESAKPLAGYTPALVGGRGDEVTSELPRRKRVSLAFSSDQALTTEPLVEANGQGVKHPANDRT